MKNLQFIMKRIRAKLSFIPKISLDLFELLIVSKNETLFMLKSNYWIHL